jgi:hypothetical protein
LKEQDEWEDYIANYSKEIRKLEQEIKNIDRKIDEIVYSIYGLTKSEITAVEDFIKE